MTYTAAQTEPLAQRLVANLPGLDISLARSWITAESGAHNNPLGVTAKVGSGKPIGQMIGPNTYLVRYPTPQAGIDAASAMLKSSSMSWAYGGVIKAIASGDRTAQAKALIASPWNARNSPYYTRVFTKAGFLSGTTKTPTTTPTKTPTNTPPTGAVQGTMAWLLGYGRTLPGRTGTGPSATTPLTQKHIDLIAGDIPVDNPNRAAIIAGLQSQIGKPVNTVKVPSNWTDTPSGGWQNFWGGQAGVNGTGGGLGNSGIGASQWWGNPTFILYVVGGMLMIVAGGWIMVRNTGAGNAVTSVASRV